MGVAFVVSGWKGVDHPVVVVATSIVVVGTVVVASLKPLKRK